MHYITYLFAAPGGNMTVLGYILFAYSVALVQRLLVIVARRFLRLLAGSRKRVMEISYAFTGGAGVSRVARDGRTIALHGAGRLRVEGTYDAGYAKGVPRARRALTFLTPREVLAAFRTQLEDRGWKGSADPLPRVRDASAGSAASIPVVTGLLALVFIGGPLLFGYYKTAQPPELDIVLDRHIDMRLEPLLLGDGRRFGETGGGCPALGLRVRRRPVAASGGGTRAAVYTASVLRGLAEQGRIGNVVLASGVSGGSAALAYFALHQDALRRPGFDAEVGRPGTCSRRPWRGPTSRRR